MRPMFSIAVMLSVAPTLCFAEDMDRRTATGSCMHFIKQGLHDPDSATFAHSNEADVFTKGNRAMVIRSVRATNAFGAKRLTEFMCLMEINNGVITPVFVAPKGENSAKARAILKKWDLFAPAKSAAKKP